VTDFAAIHNRLAPMQGYEVIPFSRAQWKPLTLAASRPADAFDLRARDLAFRTVFRTVRREVWDARESRLRATWESYG
jgi:hypothetical protein